MSGRKLKNILVTGGQGFIGSNFIHYLFNNTDFDGYIVNADKLTYASNKDSLRDIESKFKDRYQFTAADVCNTERMYKILKTYDIDTIVHFAAESHVDRSITSPDTFLKTNILGTNSLLGAARRYWELPDGTYKDGVIFHHISTDEVYGSIDSPDRFSELSLYNPRSPYAMSKASSDFLVMAYYHTYGLPITISNCSNNYGKYQHPEKFIPKMITNIRDGKDLPVYGDGSNVRDWIHVDDHNRAVWTILNKGIIGQKYNIGGENELSNNDLLAKIAGLMTEKLDIEVDDIMKTIKFVDDRKGHDRRYAIDCSKIKDQLGWKQQVNFMQGLSDTIDWYLS